MKKDHKIVLGICFFFMGCINPLFSQSYPWQDSSYKIVFTEDFNGTTLDQNKWIRRFPWGPNAPDSNKIIVPSYCSPTIANTYVDAGYAEYQYADTNFLKIRNGSAKILVKNQSVLGESWGWQGGLFTVTQNTYQYCTTMLYSKFRFRYGYFEIRFRLPEPYPAQAYMGNGPNFWLYDADHSVNNYWSEIDVFEIHGYNNQVTNNAYYSSDSTTVFAHNQPFDHNPISGGNWHTAGAYWTPQNIEFYLDGTKINQITNFNIKPDSMVKMPLILTINTPTHGWCEVYDPVNNVFPYTYEIDYVKVWQAKEACDSSKTYCSNFNPVTYTSKVYKNITIGGAGCSSPVNNYSELSIVATDYVLLNEGFSIDNNSTVLINTQPCSGTSNGFKTIQNQYIQPPPPSFRYR